MTTGQGIGKARKTGVSFQPKYLLFLGMSLLSCLYDMPRTPPSLLMQPVPKRKGMEGSEWQKEIPILTARREHWANPGTQKE